MSQEEKAISLSDSDVRIDQELLPDTFASPAVRLTLRSSRDRTVRVRLHQELPSDVEMDQIGFAEEYHKNQWSLGDGVIVFECDLHPDEKIETVYTVQSIELFDVLGDGPDIDEIQPLENDPVVDRIEQSGNTASLLNNGDSYEELTEASSKLLVEELLDRIERDDISRSLLRTMESSIDEYPTQTDSLEVRVHHLQEQLTDLEAQNAPFVEFYENHGSPTQLIEKYEQRLRDLESMVETNNDRLDEMEDDMNEMTTWVEKLNEKIDEIADWQEKVNEIFTNIPDK